MVFTNQQIEEMKNEYISLLRSTNRPGIENVIKYLTENSDMFLCPSSTHFHGNHPGGLLFHSLNCLKAARKIHKELLSISLPEKQINITDDSLIICCLLHDMCKVNFYKESSKMYKDESGGWHRYMTYEISDKFPIGHGEKSCIEILALGLKLSAQELCAIRWHMGLSENSISLSAYQKPAYMTAVNDIPLVGILIMADFWASFFMEYTVDPKIECPLPLN